MAYLIMKALKSASVEYDELTVRHDFRPLHVCDVAYFETLTLESFH